jgi:hypothetical protein
VAARQREAEKPPITPEGPGGTLLARDLRQQPLARPE